ncbi:efflux transporter, membrane fusion protein [Alcanivorax hongdengensis A-11-3]|uniref:Efflux transporter, membrane fusion protein n=1 Tax=Alcanivorax hongdengensis A-11-3 TaxID=1177179 RepID=L0WDJ9_9GAMM|nr:HlyD family secretion protein [Alcanivorax hongdengensis]EKF75096.1 efflux transporter, membrane fusion protein [Alcanivorax hongdengensis A-11-3]
MRLSLRILLTVVIVIVAILAGTWVWHYYLYAPWTRDGRIRAEVITLSPDVSGWVRQLDVSDHQRVEKGQLLLTIDDSHYRAQVTKSRAELQHQQVASRLSQHQYQRRKQLRANHAISQEDLDTAQIQAQLAEANVAIASAQLDSDELNLARTQIHAPAAGSIVNLNLRAGNYVTRGTPVMSLVRENSYYATGYFEETKLDGIHIGQKARVILMNGGHELSGHVSSIGTAIANANTRTDNQLLPQVQPSFNWVRLAQRIPVDITLDTLPDHVILAAGMTATIRLETAPHDDDGA